ncbi:MAG: exoribonuclease II [Vibrio sp.]
MFSDNPLLAQLKQQMQENLPKKEGVIKATEKSFGFLEVDSKTRYFVAPPQMKKCLHGDKVKAIIRTDGDKESAEPESLLEPSLARFIGRVKLFKGRLNVVPDHPQLKKITFKAKARKGLNPETLNDGDWVVAHLTKHPLQGDDQFFVEVSEKITDADDKIAPWWVTLAQNDLPNSEPDGIEHWEIKDDADLVRRDLTHVPFVTIDGQSTKDMDDALYIEKQDDGSFKLMIAIADPTAYITPDDEMDKVARQRGFTIYLPGRNIPMLPRDLADDLCSLKQDEKRPALCCEVTITPDGTIGDDINFFAAFIQSHARLIYDEVSDFLEQGQCATWQPEANIQTIVEQLHEFATVRGQWRQQHAVVFPDRPDYRFELSDDNDVIAIHADMRRSANKLVEEAMITANICAGRALKDAFNSGIFNTHAGLKSDRIKDVIALVNPDQDLPFTQESVVELEGFSALRRHLATMDTNYLDNRIRKYQSYSEISHLPNPHFAMGLDIYATWTSPIRKYGDMINHRMLKAMLLGKEPVQRPDESIGEELSLHRRHHGMAERNVSNWLYARTLHADVEKQTRFSAEIFDINRAGMRVRLIENGAAAFIPLSLILENKERIESSTELGTVSIDGVVEFKLGDQLEVTLADVNIETRNLVAKPTQLFSSEAPKADKEAPEDKA